MIWGLHEPWVVLKEVFAVHAVVACDNKHGPSDTEPPLMIIRPNQLQHLLT